jgi:hypothetical protein
VRVSRRWFVLVAGFVLFAAGGLAWARWWRIRRALIRLRVIAPPANLLRNAGFMQCTTGTMPDFWGTPAPAEQPDGATSWSFAEGSPVPGARMMRLTNRWRGYRLRLQAMRTFVPKPEPYTFSAYLKSDRTPAEVEIGLGWGAATRLTIDRQWRRYHVSYTPTAEARVGAGLGVSLVLPAPAVADIAAPQLEHGSRASEFDLALMDDHPLPDLAWPDRDEVLAPPATAPPRVLAIDGPTTHPIHLGISLRNPADRQLADIASHGFDTVSIAVPIGTGERDDPGLAEARRQMDAAAQHGLGVIGFFDGGSLEPSDRQKQAVPAVEALKDHPALAAWLILDEPSQHWEHPPWPAIGELRDAIKQADPAHPAFVNDTKWTPDSVRDRLASTDIGCLDCYPVGSYANPLEAVARAVRPMNADCVAAGKPSAFWLQLYGWDDVPREPTPDEARAMTYLTFLWGTRLILYWTYKPMQPALWASMAILRRELDRLSALVLGDGWTWVRTGTSARRVHYAIWHGSDRAIVAFCNGAPEDVRVSIDLGGIVRESGTRPQGWYKGTNVIVDRGRLVATMRPYARQVIELER